MKLIISNDFIRARFDCDKAIQQKVILSFLAEAKFEDNLNKEYTKTAYQIRKDLNLKNKHALDSFKQNKKIVDDFYGMGIARKVNETRYKGEPIFSSFEYDDEAKVFIYSLNSTFIERHLFLDIKLEKIKEELLTLEEKVKSMDFGNQEKEINHIQKEISLIKKSIKTGKYNYTIINLNDLASMRSPYVIKFYLLLCSYKNIKCKDMEQGKITLKIQEDLIEILKYKYSYSRLNKEVLEPSKKQFAQCEVNFNILKLNKLNNSQTSPVISILLQVYRNKYQENKIVIRDLEKITTLTNSFILNICGVQNFNIDKKKLDAMIKNCDENMDLLFGIIFDISKRKNVTNFYKYFYGILDNVRLDKTFKIAHDLIAAYKLQLEKYTTKKAKASVIKKEEIEPTLITENLDSINDLANLILIELQHLMLSNLTLEEIITIIKKQINKHGRYDEEFMKYIREAIINNSIDKKAIS